jgi:hypothetical protein
VKCADEDLIRIDPNHGPVSRTKRGLAVELPRWSKHGLGLVKKWLCRVADGADANVAFLEPAKALGMTVGRRLLKGAVLRAVPGPNPLGRRGRPGIFGEDNMVGLASCTAGRGNPCDVTPRSH